MGEQVGRVREMLLPNTIYEDLKCMHTKLFARAYININKKLPNKHFKMVVYV